MQVKHCMSFCWSLGDMGWDEGHWLDVVKGDTLLQHYMVPVAMDHEELSMKERVLLSQATWKSLYGCWRIQSWIIGQNSHLETNDQPIIINEVTNMFIFQGRIVTKFNLYSYIKLYPSSWSWWPCDDIPGARRMSWRAKSSTGDFCGYSLKISMLSGNYHPSFVNLPKHYEFCSIQ